MKTKVIIAFLLSLIFTGIQTSAQSYTDKDFNVPGKLIIKTFANFHADLSDREVKKTAFEIKRAYFGYSHSFSGKLTGQVILDVQMNSLSDKYYSFLKIAALTWTPVKGLKINGGMISPKQFKTQERFWGLRYLYKSFQDEYKMGPSADLGITVEYKFNKHFSIDGAFLNGEGYKHVQVKYPDFKLAGGMTVKPFKGLTMRLYYDNTNNKDTSRIEEHRAVRETYSVFLGYKVKNFKVAGEYNLQKQFANIKGHDLFGYSFYSTYKVSPSFMPFVRVDILSSNKIEGETEKWFYEGNGVLYMIGLQYHPVKGVNLAVNYRTWQYEKPENEGQKSPISMIYLNLEFKLN